MSDISKINIGGNNEFSCKDALSRGFTGTMAEVQAAILSGEITEGMLVYVTDADSIPISASAVSYGEGTVKQELDDLNSSLESKLLIKGITSNIIFVNSETCSVNGSTDITVSFPKLNASSSLVVAQSMNNCTALIVSFTDTSMTVRLYNLHDYAENAGTMSAAYSILRF